VSVDDARRIVEEARTAGVFPAATVEVGSSADALWSEAFGTSLQTPFDLASLTKVVATTTVVMDLIRTGTLRLDEPVSAFFGEWRGVDREGVTVRDLLEHASGLPARLVDAPPTGRREFEHDICAIALEYEPRTMSLYSDLGFILLGFLAADRGGAPLADLFDRVMLRLKPDITESPNLRTIEDDGNRHSGGDFGSVRLQPDLLTFEIPPALRRLAAPTRPMNEDSRRGRDLTGEVHDNYAAALGGVAGHAGLFGTANGVGAFARTLMRALRGDPEVPPPFSRDLVRQFITKSTVPGSSRALGWDTMLPTSSCGTKMSASAFGHVGFTGTSVWIDPARDRYFVLLTNRVLGGGTLDEMRTVRRAFHDALGDV
jgi:CubicO group peptidase (beta-lactamase class C family)